MLWWCGLVGPPRPSRISHSNHQTYGCMCVCMCGPIGHLLFRPPSLPLIPIQCVGWSPRHHLADTWRRLTETTATATVVATTAGDHCRAFVLNCHSSFVIDRVRSTCVRSCLFASFWAYFCRSFYLLFFLLFLIYKVFFSFVLFRYGFIYIHWLTYTEWHTDSSSSNLNTHICHIIFGSSIHSAKHKLTNIHIEFATLASTHHQFHHNFFLQISFHFEFFVFFLFVFVLIHHSFQIYSIIILLLYDFIYIHQPLFDYYPFYILNWINLVYFRFS